LVVDFDTEPVGEKRHGERDRSFAVPYGVGHQFCDGDLERRDQLGQTPGS
jgi:hypothetical protein